MPATENNEEFLTRKQAAYFLGVNVRTLSRRLADGSGPPRIKHGQKISFRKSKLMEWLISHESGPIRG